MAAEAVGVEMVVQGLNSFLGDMNKVDKSIQSLIPTSGLLGSAFSVLKNAAGGLADFVGNVLAHALGELLADAVEWATSKFQELIDSAIEIGGEFQALEIRLNQMNFNVAIDSGKDYTAAMQEATKATQEQLLWIQKLAFTTPFEMADITQVYSMARSFGYADKDARDLTETLSDFVFGMGLTGEAAVSITRQFGQMNNTGKILQRDLNALAQGGMIPVNKILDIMREKTGLSEKAFKDFLLTAEGVQSFRQTFSEYVEKNYAGAAEKANRTFRNATITLKEFFSTLLAGNVVKPILDVLGERIASINDAFQAQLPEITAGFERIGKAIGDILNSLFGLAPSASGMANGFVGALDSIASWLENNKQGIIDFFLNTIDWITATAIPAFQDLWKWIFGGETTDTNGKTVQVQGALQGFLDWASTEGIPLLQEFWGWVFGTKNEETGTTTPSALSKIMEIITALSPIVAPFIGLLAALGEVIAIAFGGTETQTFAQFVTETLVPAITDLTTWITENKKELADLIAFLGKLAIVIEVGTWIMGFIGVFFTALTIIGFVITGIISLSAAFAALPAVVAAVIAAVFVLFVGGLAAIALVVTGWIAKNLGLFESWRTVLWNTVTLAWNGILSTFVGWIEKIVASAINFKNRVVSSVTEMTNNITSAIQGLPNKFADIGKNMMRSMADGISNGIDWIVDAASGAASRAYEAAMSALQMGSPSKLFIEMGEFTMEGLAIGIQRMAGLAASSMENAIGKVVAPASAAPSMTLSAASGQSGSTYNTNIENNLNIQSNANSENIIADFTMMSSLAGV